MMCLVFDYILWEIPINEFPYFNPLDPIAVLFAVRDHMATLLAPDFLRENIMRQKGLNEGYGDRKFGLVTLLP